MVYLSVNVTNFAGFEYLFSFLLSFSLYVDCISNSQTLHCSIVFEIPVEIIECLTIFVLEILSATVPTYS